MPKKALDDEIVMTLVELALARPADERKAYVQSACAGDQDLREAVWDYVRWEARMNGFLLEPLYSIRAMEHPFEPGDLLEQRFRIIREVAQGGMGIVYEAMDEKLKRPVALKCAKPGFDNRLPPEARNATQIAHANVCKIFEIHTASTRLGEEIDFLTMEFLEGETLAERLARDALPEAEALTIARQLCAGLAEAHRNRVIHGDLKSNNVILTTGADGAVRAVITDFGLAKGAEGALLPAHPGVSGGTPDYMAPELRAGEKASVASDIYALGVIFHEMVYRRRPQSPGNTVAHKAKWDRILARCLDPDPLQRFADADEIAEALAPRRVLRWWFAAAAAVALAAVTGAVAYERAIAPKQSWRLSLLPIESSSAETAALSGDLSREAAAQLRQLKGGTVARLTFVDASRNSKAALQATHKLRTTLTEQDKKILVYAVLTDARSGVNIKAWTAAYNPEEVRRYAPLALAGMVSGALHLPPLAEPSVNSAASKDYEQGVRDIRQNSTLDAALRALQRAVAEDPSSPFTYGALAEAQCLEYFWSDERTWLDSAKNSLREAEIRDPDLPAAHRVEGYLHYADDSYSQAQLEFQRAIELQPGSAMAYIYLGKAYEDDNQPDRALTAFLKATEVEPGYFRTWQNLGAYYQNRANFREMAKYDKKAVDLAPKEPNLHANLAGAYLSLGQFAETEYEARLSNSMQETPAADNDLGQALMNEGRDAEAAPIFKRALSLSSPQGRTPKYLILMYLGIAQRRLHHMNEAKDAYTRGLKMVEAENPRNVKDGDLKSFLGYFSAVCGDTRQAVDYIETALGLFRDNTNTRWRAVLTYEELYRVSKDPSFRKRTLEILGESTGDQLADISRWPDLADLHADQRFKDLLASRTIR
jgi:eukaryotic-like serine/threonine-protein kinase